MLEVYRHTAKGCKTISANQVFHGGLYVELTMFSRSSNSALFLDALTFVLTGGGKAMNDNTDHSITASVHVAVYETIVDQHGEMVCSLLF